jgi:hypothetical protein
MYAVVLVFLALKVFFDCTGYYMFLTCTRMCDVLVIYDTEACADVPCVLCHINVCCNLVIYVTEICANVLVYVTGVCTDIFAYYVTEVCTVCVFSSLKFVMSLSFI